MKVIIVGAGISGLTLAISLSQAKHHVLLLESAPALAEIGAGVQMTPNAIKCLFDQGLREDLLAKSALPAHMNILHGKQGHVLGSIALGDFESQYGAPYILIHRAILHDILHKHALKAGAELRVNSKVSQYLFSTGTVVLTNGEHISGDLVVAADGINSLARNQLLSPHYPATIPTGWAAYRLLASVSTLKTHPSLASITVNDSHSSNLWIGPHQSAMTYLIKNASMLNIVLSHRDNIETSDWSPQRYRQEVTGMFADWHPLLRDLLDLTLPEITNYPVHRVPPLGTWVHGEGKFCLVGDAAHAMAFYLSMGVSLAVEDAVALSEALEVVKVDCGGDEGERLKLAMGLFERVRKTRAEAVQAASTHAGDVLHVDDGEKQKIRDEGLKRSGEYWPDDGDSEGKTQWLYGIADRRTRDWCYGYDVKGAVWGEWNVMRKEMEKSGNVG